MTKRKLQRFNENEAFNHLFQPKREDLIDEFELKNNWNNLFFKNSNPIVLELGCGKGDYTIALAKKYPTINFIGIDLKGARLWRGAKTIEEEDIKNAAFIRTQIELIDCLFGENEISEIWITFPDPQIKLRRAKHRLTHPTFLEKYKHILHKEGVVHLKTDSEFLFGYTNGLIEANNYKILLASHNIYQKDNHNLPDYITSVKTFYEKKFIDTKNITYLKFKF